jgi:APA family basic amino acid/polyamine antiporter
MGIAFCILLIKYKPQFTWPGLYITLAGIPLYYIINTIYTHKKTN